MKYIHNASFLSQSSSLDHRNQGGTLRQIRIKNHALSNWNNPQAFQNILRSVVNIDGGIVPGFDD